MEYPFSLENDDNLIIVKVEFNMKHEAHLVLDTGCTNTVITTLEAQKMGFSLDKRKTTTVRTGSKEHEPAKEITMDTVECLGHIVENLEILTFDVAVEKNKYIGYLGLDFFADKKLTIDFKKQLLILE